MFRAPLIVLAVVLSAASATAREAEGVFAYDRATPIDFEAPAAAIDCDSWDACHLDCAAVDLCATEEPQLRFSVPAWLAEAHGSATVRGVETPVNVTTRTLFETFDDVNFGVIGRVEADVERWGLLIDGSYVNISGNREFLGGRINASSGFEHAIVDSAVTCDLFEPAGGSSTELLLGARYWLLGGDVTVTGPRGNSIGASGTRQWVDPIVGGRIAAPLTDDLLMRVRADVGGFGVASDFTWNVEAVGEYRCSERCGLQFGYRVLDADYSRGDGFAYDVNYRGPIATLMFTF